MSQSVRFQEMAEQIELAVTCLLPAVRDPMGTYPPEVYLRASAFRVLAHAEIEAYLEDRTWEIALATTKAWKAGLGESRTLLCLVAYSGLEMKAPPLSMQPITSSQVDVWEERADLTKRIDAAMATLAHAISQNHGIKEENLLRLLLPIGVSVDTLSAVLVADINSFSERRGEAAHSSASVRRQVDPMDDLSAVRSIISGLKEIDDAFDTLLARISKVATPPSA